MEDFPEVAHRLSGNAGIIPNEVFEMAVVKLQRLQIDQITDE